jgi:hypothetical protein
MTITRDTALWVHTNLNTSNTQQSLPIQKRCRLCTRIRPLSEFRYRNKATNTRFNQCRQCHNAAERTRRTNRQQIASERQITKYLSQICDKRHRRNVGHAVTEMIQTFGGIEGFTKAWNEYYKSVKSKGGYGTLRVLESIIKMMQYHDESAQKISILSDAELEHSISDSVTELIELNPVLAIHAAKTLGWTLIPTNLDSV